MKSMSTRGMARYNRDLILGLLREERVLSRNEIRKRLGSSPATINRLTTQLLERGILLEDGFAASTGGRPSTLMRLDGRVGVVGAVDIGSGILRAALVSLTGEIVSTIERPVRDTNARERLSEVQELVEEVAASAEGVAPMLAVGIGVPGVVDGEGKVTWAPALGWHDVPLQKALTEVVPVPVTVENDANTLAIAEYRYGERRGASSLVAINLGNGVGAGLIIDGALYRGFGGAAGEIGYMLASRRALQETFEGFGHLENRVGAAAIVDRAAAAHPGEPLAGAYEVFARAREGESQYRGVVDAVADDIALAVANISVVLNPEVIVFGGGMAGSGDLLIPRIEERLAGRIPHVPELCATSLGSHGVLVGASESAIDAVGSLDEALA